MCLSILKLWHLIVGGYHQHRQVIVRQKIGSPILRQALVLQDEQKKEKLYVGFRHES